MGDGFESASSPFTLSADGTLVWTPGSAFMNRVSHSGWKRSCVDIPPMKPDDGSNPSGGRVNVLCSLWKMPSRFTCPTAPRSYRADNP